MAVNGYGTGKSLFQENLEKIMAQAKTDPNWVYAPSFRSGMTIEEENIARRLKGLEPIGTDTENHTGMKGWEDYKARNNINKQSGTIPAIDAGKMRDLVNQTGYSNDMTINDGSALGVSIPEHKEPGNVWTPNPNTESTQGRAIVNPSKATTSSPQPTGVGALSPVDYSSALSDWAKLNEEIMNDNTITVNERAERVRKNISNMPKLEHDLDAMERASNKKTAEDTAQNVYEFSKDNKIMGAALNLGLSLTTPAAGVETVKQYLENIGNDDYKPDPYAPGMISAIAQKATEEGVLDGLGPVASFFASTGLSIGQNALRLPLGPLGLVNMGVGTGGQTAQDIMERGGNTGQALASGVIAGSVEYLTEKLPFDNLMDLVAGGKKTISKGAVKEVLKQAGVEFGEEAISEYANTLTDMAVMGKDSEYEKYIQSMTELGMSRAEAEKNARIKFFAANPFMSGLSGAISGGVMGGPAVVLGNSHTKALGQSLGQDSIGELINNGLASAEDSDGHRMAALAKEKTDKGEALTEGEIGSLFLQLISDDEKRAKKNKDIDKKPDDPELLKQLDDIETGGAAIMKEAPVIQGAGLPPMPSPQSSLSTDLGDPASVKAVEGIGDDRFARAESPSQSVPSGEGIPVADIPSFSERAAEVAESKLSVHDGDSGKVSDGSAEQTETELLSERDALLRERMPAAGEAKPAAHVPDGDAQQPTARPGAEREAAAVENKINAHEPRSHGILPETPGIDTGIDFERGKDRGLSRGYTENAVPQGSTADEYGQSERAAVAAENRIAKYHFDESDNESIKDTIVSYAESSGKAGNNVASLVDAVDLINLVAADRMKQVFGTVNGVSGKLYSRIAKLVTKPDAAIAGDFVRDYAEQWVDALEKKNSANYNNLLTREGLTKNMIGKLITDYVTTGELGESTANESKSVHLAGDIAKSIIATTASDFKEWLTGTVRDIARVNNNATGAEGTLQEQAKLIAKGDWVGALGLVAGTERSDESLRLMPETPDDRVSDNSIPYRTESINAISEGSVLNGSGQQTGSIRPNPVFQDGGRQNNDGITGAARKSKQTGKRRRASAWGSGFAAYTAENPVVTKQGATVDSTGRTIRYNEVTNPEYDALKRQLRDTYGGEYIFFDGQATVHYTDENETASTDSVDGFVSEGKVYVSFGMDTEKLAIHERVHIAARGLADSYADLEHNVLQLFDADRFYDLYEKYNGEYAKVYGNLSAEEYEKALLQEIVADVVSDAMTRRLDAGLFESKEAAATVGEYVNDFALDNMYESEYKNLIDSGGDKRDIRFSLYKNVKGFANQVDKWLRGEMKSSEDFDLGETPIVLRKLGAKNLPLIMTQDVIAKTTGEKHSIALGELKNLPRAISDPIAIFQSATYPDAYVVVTELEDKKGNEVVAAVHLNKHQKNHRVNRIASVYGKDNIGRFIEAGMSKGEVRYINRNRSGLWLRSRGLQLPKLETFLANAGDSADDRQNTVSTAHQRTSTNNILTERDIVNDSILQNHDNNSAGSDTVFSKPVTYNATEIMLRANLRDGKVYSMTEAKRVTDDIIKATIQDGYSIRIRGKDTVDIARVTHALLNNPNKGRRMKLAGEIAERIVESAVINKGANDFETYRELYKDLTAHRNKLDFSAADKAELKYLYDAGGARDKLLFWGGGNMPVDSFYGELSEMYPYVFPGDIANTGDQMMKIFDTFDRIQDLRNQPTEYLRDVVGDETALELSRNIAGQLALGLEGGADSKVNRIKADAAKGAQKKIEDVATRYERQISELKTQQAASIKDVREKRDRSIAEVREKYKEQRERRKGSEYRSKLLNVAKRVARIKTTAELKRQIKGLIGDLDLVSKGMTKNNRLDLQELREKYIAASEYYGEDYIPRKDLVAMLDRLDKKQISDMTIEDVRDLTEVLIKMEHEIKTANKLINDARKRDVYSTAITVTKEISEARGTDAKPGAIRLAKYLMFQLSPSRFFSYLQGWGKGETYGIYNMLNDGQIKMMDFQMKATKMFDEFNKKNKKLIQTWQGKNAEFIDTGLERYGKPIRITPGMRISLYLHNKNEQNRRHMGYLNDDGKLSGGGITIPDEGLYKKGDYVNAYGKGVIAKLTSTEIANIAASMKEEEKEFADLAYEFFNVASKNAINEVSLALDGYEIATVEDYFPIVSNKAFTRQEFESLLRDGRLEGMGILKNRIDGSNPIVLEDITSILTRHIDNTSKYVGMAIPIRNFNKIYNTTLLDYEGSVKNTIGETWGDFALKYIEKLMTDLQFPNKQQTDKLSAKIRSNYAKAILSINIGSALKQTMSLPYAASVLGWKTVIRGLTAGQVDTEIIDRYTPVLWYRNKGAIDTELGEIAAKQTWDKKLPGLMDWMQRIDSLTTKRIWKTAEFYVSENYPKLPKDTPAYYNVVAEWFNKTVLETQSNYSILQRPHVLRTDSEMLRAVTMFSTDRFQGLNMIVQAWGEFNYAVKDYKDNKDAANTEAVKKARLALARVLTGLIGGALGTALVNIVNSLLTGRLDRYKDDEGNIKAESVAKSVFWETSEQLFGMPLIGAELFSLIEAWIMGDNYYEIQSIPVQTVADTIKSFFNLSNVKNPENIPGAVRTFVRDASELFGIPVGNVEKYLLGASRLIDSDIKRYHDIIFSPNKKVAVNDFWGESTVADKVDKLNERIAAANERLKPADRLTPVSLPTRFYKFTLDKREYVLTPSERMEYEKELKERIERAMMRINVDREPVADTRKSIREAISATEKELKERYAREHR